ncbi:hypothetical protein DNH61_23090 [Paenibacillus sambharensis]|uniref:Tyrosinase copper-binding domain-containing protein n=1 Tax=Paenibacillus sambharensis TaxID=1803190 RepID=A0A2W1L3Q4_9BACL|nr:hypothetical protein [Paenibacillus sambharensis]PZD93509.1 hypothetical protein DNH61_23090 [Paenibacillus sambharensis]
MIAGYLSVWLLLSGMILIMTGWRRELIGGCSMRIAALFLVPLTAMTLLSAGRPVYYVLLPVAWLWLWAMMAITKHEAAVHQTYIYLTALLTAAAWIWMRKLYWFDPVFVILHPYTDAPLLAALAAAFMSARFRDQFAVLALSSTIGELGSVLIPLKELTWRSSVLDSRVLLDSFLLAMAGVRLVTVLLSLCVNLYAKLRRAGKQLLNSIAQIRGKTGT